MDGLRSRFPWVPPFKARLSQNVHYCCSCLLLTALKTVQLLATFVLVSETMLFITKLSKLAAALFKRCSKEPRLRSTATIVEVQEVWQPSVYDEDDEAFEPTPIFWCDGDVKECVVHTTPTFILVAEATKQNRYSLKKMNSLYYNKY